LARSTTVSSLPTVSVVVVGYNGRRWLQACLLSIIDQDYPPERLEVLYVDNCSMDGSAEFVERCFSSVQVHRLERNIGFYAAFNAAAESAIGELLVAFPQDMIAHRQWLSEMAAAADEGHALVIVSNTLGPDSPGYTPSQRDAEGQRCTWVDLSRLGYVKLTEGPIGDRPRETLAAVGCTALRRDILTLSGEWFDGSAGHYAGDVEVGLRAFVVGGKVVQAPRAIVYHAGETTKSLGDLGLLVRYAAGSRDQVIAFYKNMTTVEFALFVPVLLVGLPWKATQLRVGRITRLAVLAAALPFSPIVLLSALVKIPSKREARRSLLARRTIPDLRLLGAIILGNR
jgi:hypothetical protein